MLEVTATNLPRVMNCPGWLFMPASKSTVDDPTARDEGNAAHYVAKMVFDGETIGVDAKAPNGFVMSGEMIDFAQEFVSMLDCGAMEVVTSFGSDNWRVNARADHIKYRDGILTIDEFKYGWRIVEPRMNWTLIAHAIGYCIANNIAPSEIRLRIHQPRPYHQSGKVREWVSSYDDLQDYYAQINETLSNPPVELRTGPHCAKCPALANCPAARAASMNAIDVTGIAFSDDLPGDLLSFELDTLRIASETLKTRLEALEELAAHHIRNGSPVRNYHMKERYGDSRFKTGITAPIIKALIGIDCSKVGTVTPAEAKRRAKGNPVALAALDTLIDRPMIGTKLIRADSDDYARKLLGK